MSDTRTGSRQDREPAGGVGALAVSGAASDGERFGLQEIGSRSWQVVDRRRPDGDPFRTLALIRSLPGAYEVMQFGRGFEWTTFVSLDQALAHVIVTSVELARTRAEGDSDLTPSSAAG